MRQAGSPETPLSGYRCETSSVSVGAGSLRIRALLDTQQFADADGAAEGAGISSATWPLFGVLWPSSRVIAEAMVEFPVDGRRVLEVGCGLGLASLVLAGRGVDITASDLHPLADSFLRHNSGLNGLADIPFCRADWGLLHPELGRFDLIIGSDLLYERGHPVLLAAFLERHAAPRCEVLIADPGRDRCGAFATRMVGQGFTRRDTHQAFTPGEAPPHRGRVMRFRRATAGAPFGD